MCSLIVWGAKIFIIFFIEFLILFWGIAVNIPVNIIAANNVVIISGEQRRDSAMNIHVSIFPKPPPIQAVI